MNYWTKKHNQGEKRLIKGKCVFLDYWTELHLQISIKERMINDLCWRILCELGLPWNRAYPRFCTFMELS